MPPATELASRRRSALSHIYDQRFPQADVAHRRWRREIWEVLVEEFFSRWIPPQASVLDFGCGLGEFINSVRAARRIAVDGRPEVAANLDGGVEFQLSEGIGLPGVG